MLCVFSFCGGSSDSDKKDSSRHQSCLAQVGHEFSEKLDVIWPELLLFDQICPGITLWLKLSGTKLLS